MDLEKLEHTSKLYNTYIYAKQHLENAMNWKKHIDSSTYVYKDTPSNYGEPCLKLSEKENEAMIDLIIKMRQNNLDAIKKQIELL